MIPEDFNKKAYLKGKLACRNAKGDTQSKFANNPYITMDEWCSWNKGWNDQLDKWDEGEKSK